MTALVVFGSVAVYLVCGFFLGRRRVPQFLAHMREEYPSLYNTPEPRRQRDLRNEGAGYWVLWILFWPIMAAIRGTAVVLGRQVERVDPRAAELKNRALQTRIHELERELGIR